MSDDRFPDAHRDDDLDVDPEFDARARAAGRALREPAPPDGLTRVRAAKRRRTAVQTGAVTAVALLVVGGIAVVLRGGDDTTQITDVPPTETTAPTSAVIDPSPNESAPVDSSPVDSSPVDSAPIEAGETTVPPTDPPETSETSAPTTDTAPPSVEYVSAGFYAGPEWVGDRTAAITDPLADGLYYADDYSSDGTTLSLTLVQRIRGQACVEEFGENAGDACASDSGRVNDPSTVVTTTADGLATSVIVEGGIGAGTGFEAFRVPADEFVRLAAGQAPSVGAPEGYTWIPFGVFVEISGGRVVSVHQQFQS